MEEVGNSNSNSSTPLAQNEHKTTEIKCTASCTRKQLINSSRGKTMKGIAENTWRIMAYQ
jgi:3D (Asp-Asp-Asp) domain-containing protein